MSEKKRFYKKYKPAEKVGYFTAAGLMNKHLKVPLNATEAELRKSINKGCNRVIKEYESQGQKLSSTDKETLKKLIRDRLAYLK